MSVFADVDGADPIEISDTAYNATTWNGSLDAPTKNVVRDKFESVATDISTAVAAVISDTAYNETTWNGVTTIAPSKNAVRDFKETMQTSIDTNTTNISALPSTGDNILANQVFS